MPPHVLLVGDLDPPTGGVATYCRQLTAELDSLGWRVTIIDTVADRAKPPARGAAAVVGTTPRADVARALTRPRELATELRARGAKDAATLTARQRVRAIGLAALVEEEARTRGADIVLTNHASPRSLAAEWGADRAGLPSAVMVHGSEFTAPQLVPQHPTARAVCGRATLRMANSRSTAAAAAAIGVVEPIEVVHLGVDLELFRPGSPDPAQLTRFGLDPARPIVLFAGWLIANKGPQVLLEAWAGLPQELRRATQCVLIGADHGLRDSLRARVRALSLDGAFVLDPIDRRELAGLYRSAAIFVLPTTAYEGFGLVALEAAASGCAVIGSRIAAIPEVVDEGTNGMLVQPGSVEELRGAIDGLLRNPQLLAQLRAASPMVAARFSWQRTARRTAELLERAVAAGARPRG